MLITNYLLLFPSLSPASKCDSTKILFFSVLRGFYHVLEQLEMKLIGKQLFSPLFWHFCCFISICFSQVRLVFYALSSFHQKYWLIRLASYGQIWEKNWQLRNEDTKVLGGEVSWTLRWWSRENLIWSLKGKIFTVIMTTGQLYIHS